MGQSVLLRSFAAGELDPGLSLRGDLDLYTRGLRTCRNFVVRRSGGVVSRPGLEHIATCKNAYRTLLYAYVFPAADRSYVIEAGDFYFRFHHRLRGLVQEIATPYSIGTLDGTNPVTWHQSGLVLVLTHLSHPPHELTMTAEDVFALTPAVLGPTLLPPEGLSATQGVMGTALYGYQVTSVQAGTYEESLPCARFDLVSAGVPTPLLPHRLTWLPVAGAVEYKVYRADGETGTFGYLGTATGQETFDDVGLAMDYAFTPPLFRPLFDTPDTNPATSAVHQQRRIYGGTHTARDVVYASRVGLPGNFTYRSPLQDDDAITWRSVTKDLQVIRHMLSVGRQLVILTDRGEWIVRGDSDGGLTPTTIYPDQVGYVGAGYAVPAIYGDRVLFIEARDVSVREFVLDARSEGLSGRDLTRNAAHLFRGVAIRAMAFALIPDAVLWIVRSDGVLLGLTYIPDEDVVAWHHHDTEGGLFEDVVVIPEPMEDAVYVVVNRGGTRTVERLGVRDEPTTALALDRAVRYRGPATTHVAGLAHLVGQRVQVVVNGTPLPRRLPVGPAGTLSLPAAYAVVDVGLPITCDLETLDLDVGGSPARDRRKKVTALAIQVERSLQNFFAGPDAAHLKPVAAAPWENAAVPKTGRVELAPTGTFNDDGRVFLRHTAPTTLTVLGVFPTVDIGG